MRITENQNKPNRSTSSGIGFSGLLTIAFIVLKLCKVIDWSWWWVLAPAWITFLIVIICLIVIVVISVIQDR